jgi:zinc ribbon protein
VSEARYCSKCGAPLPEGATFCPKCGTPVTAAPPQGAPPARQYRYEKHEKGEKREKGEKGEKAEKGREGDISGAVIGGLILVWLGISFYLQQIGTIPADRWWAYFIFGIGVLLVLRGVVQLSKGWTYSGSIVGGAILMVVGFVFIENVQFSSWPLILVIIGAAIIFTGLAGRRRVPKP